MKIQVYSCLLIIVAGLSFPTNTISMERTQTSSPTLAVSGVSARTTIEQLRVPPKTHKQLSNLILETKKNNTSRAVIFAGPDQAEKLKSAEVIADKLNRPLIKTNVKKIVRKYIGETEKNIDAIFRKAQSQKAILFFDEADALFGKRTKISDAHDRYANQEVSYLLKRMKRYLGLIIVSTQDIPRMRQVQISKNQSIITFPCKHSRNCQPN